MIISCKHLCLLSVSLTTLLISCAEKKDDTDYLELFKAFHEAENEYSETKWDYLSDTLKVWYTKNDPKPDLKYKGQPTDGWDEWDMAMRTISYYDTIWYDPELRAVQGYFNENNDFYVLLGASPNVTLRTYTYNDAGKITDLRYEKVNAENTLSKAHMDPVYQWAMIHEPEEISAIFPDNKLVPSADNAMRWKQLIIRYRTRNETRENPTVE